MRAEISAFVGRRVRSAADADDITQDALVRIHAGLPDLQDSDRMGPWMTRIARNAITDHYRRRSSQARRADAAADDPTFLRTIEADANGTAELLSTCILPFIDLLDEPYREALRLTEIDGLSQREAADKLGISHSGMKSRVQRGRAKLRSSVEQCCAVQLDVRNRVVDFEPREQPTCCD